MTNYIKQPSSRILNDRSPVWAGSGTLATVGFSAQISQVRVAASVPIWIAIGNSTSTSTTLNVGTIPTTLGGSGVLISGGAAAEYFAVTQGESLLVSSTSTTTTVGIFSVTEMT